MTSFNGLLKLLFLINIQTDVICISYLYFVLFYEEKCSSFLSTKFSFF